MKTSVNKTVQTLLQNNLLKLEKHFDADILSYTGPIVDGNENDYLSVIEQLATEKKKKTIYIILTTMGGSSTSVERYVNITRKHYDEVNFIIPDYAYSAGTIFCMSGDNILMDYFSVLGPIDPQVLNREGKLVPALGYLDKVNEMIDKGNKLTQAEFLILKDIDLAELRGYEQAKELTIALLKKWLVKYKFKNWTKHETTPGLIGTAVTKKQKEKRAEEIADKLSDNKIWKSHSRPINIHTIENELLLKIKDYSNLSTERILIRDYYNLASDYIKLNKFPIWVHTRKRL